MGIIKYGYDINSIKGIKQIFNGNIILIIILIIINMQLTPINKWLQLIYAISFVVGSYYFKMILYFLTQFVISYVRDFFCNYNFDFGFERISQAMKWLDGAFNLAAYLAADGLVTSGEDRQKASMPIKKLPKDCRLSGLQSLAVLKK